MSETADSLSQVRQQARLLRAQEVMAGIASMEAHWHAEGTLMREALATIGALAYQIDLRCSVETGCGNSTLMLSNMSKRHLVFTVEEGDSFRKTHTHPLLNEASTTFVLGPTQRTLPTYAFEEKIQLAFIDGPHGYPFPELEYYFLYPHIETDGILAVDDIQIPTIFQLFCFLKEDAMWELIKLVGNTAFFRRTEAPLFNPYGDGWWEQNYNKRRNPVSANYFYN